MPQGGVLHERADEVVSDNVEQELLLDHGWGKTAQHIKREDDFDFAEVQLDAPALEVESGKGGSGISERIAERGNQDEGATAAAFDLQVHADLAQGQSVGQGRKFFRVDGVGALRGFFPREKDVVVTETFAFAEIDLAGMVEAHHRIDSARAQ